MTAVKDTQDLSHGTKKKKKKKDTQEKFTISSRKDSPDCVGELVPGLEGSYG